MGQCAGAPGSERTRRREADAGRGDRAQRAEHANGADRDAEPDRVDRKEAVIGVLGEVQVEADQARQPDRDRYVQDRPQPDARPRLVAMSVGRRGHDRQRERHRQQPDQHREDKACLQAQHFDAPGASDRAQAVAGGDGRGEPGDRRRGVPLGRLRVDEHG